MNELVFNSFSFTITPNALPSWSGDVPYLSFDPEVRIVTASLPINKIGSSTEYIDLELWVSKNSKSNEAEMSLSGELYSTRNIGTVGLPTVIAPCSSFTDVDEDEDGELDYAEYNIIYAETFEQAIFGIFEETGWKVAIGCANLNNFPVVTEIEPILVLNGSKLDQLSQLLQMFTPTDLFDQGLVFVVNPFTNTIIITPPTGGETNINELAVEDARVFDVSVTEEDIQPPQKIYIQEDPSAMFRHLDHFEDFKYRLYQYDFETSLHEDLLDPSHLWVDRFEDWELDLDIIAKVSGEQVIIGDTVIVDVEETSIYEIETRIMYGQDIISMSFPLLTGPYIDWRPSWYKWITTHATNVKSRTEYSYIIGPPYTNPILYTPCDDTNRTVLDEAEHGWWDNLPYAEPPPLIEEPVTVEDEEEDTTCISDASFCFDYSLPWVTNQLARDYGAIVIDKDHLPEYITSNDGLRVYSKKVISIEQSGREVFYTDNRHHDRYEIPAFEDLDSQETSVTIAEERYTYDEFGNLVGVHEHKQIKSYSVIVIEDIFKIYKAITTGITSVVTYSISRRYDSDYNLISTSITNVDVDTVTGNISGPSAVSPIESLEEKDISREKLFRSSGQRTVLKLFNKSISEVQDVLTETLYVTMDNLTLEEIEEYLTNYFNTIPTVKYEVAFASNFLDVRGIIGGYLQLTHTNDPNVPIAYDAQTTDVKELHSSGIFEAMQKRPFRVDGLVMNWDNKKLLTVAVVAKQVI